MEICSTKRHHAKVTTSAPKRETRSWHATCRVTTKYIHKLRLHKVLGWFKTTKRYALFAIVIGNRWICPRIRPILWNWLHFVTSSSPCYKTKHVSRAGFIAKQTSSDCMKYSSHELAKSAQANTRICIYIEKHIYNTNVHFTRQKSVSQMIDGIWCRWTQSMCLDK